MLFNESLSVNLGYYWPHCSEFLYPFYQLIALLVRRHFCIIDLYKTFVLRIKSNELDLPSRPIRRNLGALGTRERCNAVQDLLRVHISFHIGRTQTMILFRGYAFPEHIHWYMVAT